MALRRSFSSDGDDTHSKPKKRYSPVEALAKIQSYCSYQERSHLEVRNKLFTYGLYASQVEQLITQLITDGFLNEERFAKAFAGGKFRMKKWGRNKIEHELKSAGVTSRCIQKGLKEIEPEQYRKTLDALLKKKWQQTTESNRFKKRNTVARFLIGKGYEPELVWALLKEAEDE